MNVKIRDVISVKLSKCFLTLCKNTLNIVYALETVEPSCNFFIINFERFHHTIFFFAPLIEFNY